MTNNSYLYICVLSVFRTFEFRSSETGIPIQLCVLFHFTYIFKQITVPCVSMIQHRKVFRELLF